MGMTDAIDLTTEQRRTLSDLLRRLLPGVAVWAYGSRVKWTACPNSDLDLVAFATHAQRPQVAELKDALAESNLPFPVDLHVWDDVPERFREIIRKGHVVVQEAKNPGRGSGIADGWNSCTIGDLNDAGIVELQTGPFGTQLHAHDYVEGGVPVVPTEAIRNRQIDHSVLPKVASGKAEELARHRLERGDILFARRGVQATGHIGCVREAEEGFLCGTGAIRLRVKKIGSSVNPDFLSHVLANPASVEWFKFHAIGATMPNLNEGIIRSFPLQIPPMPEQRAIAHILGTLDDKIELNRRMNETLEAMARALFKSWFVDFDPVRAKADGRDTGLPKHIADLFPDSFEDSELGEIPRGWAVTTVGKVADVMDCLHSKKPERRKAGRPLLQLGNIRENGLIDMHERYLIDEIDYRYWVSRMEASPGDCVITNVGRVGAAAQMPVGQKAALGRNMTGLRCKPGFPFPTVLIECLLSEFMKNEIQLKMDTGTILDALNVRNIPRLRFVCPKTVLILECFEQKVRPIRAQMESRLAESRTLASLRDRLLPKLISGELRVKSEAPSLGM